MASEPEPASSTSPPARASAARPGSGRDELGTARWTTPEELRQRFMFDGSRFFLNHENLWAGYSDGEIWLGETADIDADPVGYADDRHVCLVSGSRGGKGTSVIIPNLCFWPGSCFVVDPKGENATVTARRRGAGSEYCYGLGQGVCILDPFDEVQLDPSLKSRFNPLDAIDPDGDFAVDDAGRIAAAVVVSEGQDQRFFEDSALTLIKGLILHVLTDPDFAGKRNLVSVYRLANQGDWQCVEALRQAGREKIPSAFELLWEAMRNNPRYNGLIAGIGEEMSSMSDRQRDGIRKTAATHLDFIGGPPMQRILETSDIDLARIKNDPRGLTVYLTLPQRYMKTHFRWLRLMTDLAIGEMERIKGKPATGYPTLFLLDEFAALKRMEVIEHAAAQAAGFGTKFFFIVQSLVQLKDVYKENWETFLGNAGLKMYFNIEDNFTRTYLSQQLGEREVRRETASGSRTLSHGQTVTEGRSFTTTVGTGTSTQTGYSYGESVNVTKGGSIGSSLSRGGGSRGKQTSTSVGSNWSRSTGSNWTKSISHTVSHNRSEAEGTSYSVSHSVTASVTAGWSDTIHKRLLLNPDEIGRLLAPIANRAEPAYPGLMAALIVGESPILLRRVNYFQSPRFAGFFDPHPDHPRPPTLAELAERARLALSAKESAAVEGRKISPLHILRTVVGLYALSNLIVFGGAVLSLHSFGSIEGAIQMMSFGFRLAPEFTILGLLQLPVSCLTFALTVLCSSDSSGRRLLRFYRVLLFVVPSLLFYDTLCLVRHGPSLLLPQFIYAGYGMFFRCSTATGLAIVWFWMSSRRVVEILEMSAAAHNNSKLLRAPVRIICSTMTVAALLFLAVFTKWTILESTTPRSSGSSPP